MSDIYHFNANVEAVVDTSYLQPGSQTRKSAPLVWLRLTHFVADSEAVPYFAVVPFAELLPHSGIVMGDTLTLDATGSLTHAIPAGSYSAALDARRHDLARTDAS